MGNLSGPINDSISSVPGLQGPTLHPTYSLKCYFIRHHWTNDYDGQRNRKVIGRAAECTQNSIISKGHGCH